MHKSIHLIKAHTAKEIRQSLKDVLHAHYAHLLPVAKDAPIVIKPNLNSNMNALTGNTTDLRVLAAIVEFLKDCHYSNITIAEGTNSGFYRNDISVISRLCVDKLGAHYGVQVVDLNRTEGVPVRFEGGVEANVSKVAAQAALLINVPKLKTHFETTMTVCLKNLMGTLVGQTNKKKTHESLSQNIVNLNMAIRPALHIVDALIAMEGTGPTRGTPIRTDTIFVGSNPFLLDLVCARFASIDYKLVGPLRVARERGLITDEHLQVAADFPIDHVCAFELPRGSVLARIIHSPKRQKYFLKIRNTRFFSRLAASNVGGAILFATGLRQDVFIKEEMAFKGLMLDKSLCTMCGKCAAYCPVDISLPQALEGNPDGGPGRCIECLYCCQVCPERAIRFHGTFGFMAEQMKQYDELIRKIA